MARRIVVIAVMTALIFTGCVGSGSASKGQPKGDVKIIGCAVAPGGVAVADLTVTNRGVETATYLVFIVISGSGVQATASTSANDLAPRRSVTEQARSGATVAQKVPLHCMVSSVLRAPARTR